MADEELDTVLAGFTPVALEALDDRAALLRRVDFKYLLSPGELLELLRRFAGDHDALEIDGRRRFTYRTVYFDTPEVRTFHDHVAGRRTSACRRATCHRSRGPPRRRYPRAPQRRPPAGWPGRPA